MIKIIFIWRNLLIILLIILISSCKRTKTIKNEQKYFVNNEKKIIIKDETLNMSKFFKSVEYKIFNIPDSIVIGEITSYFKLGNYQILIDHRYSKAIYLFDEQNNFLKKIKKLGEGPEEYKKIVSSSIDEKGKRILIFDRRMIKIYSFPDFKYLKSIDVRGKGAFADMIYFANNIYLYSISRFSNKLGMLSRININSEESVTLIREVPEILDKTSWIGKKQFSIFNDTLYFVPSFSKNFYIIDSLGNISIKFKIINEDIIPDYSRFLKEKINKVKLIYKISDYYSIIYTLFLAKPDLLCLSIPYKKKQYFSYSNINSNSLIFYSKRINDIGNNISTYFLLGNFVYNNINRYVESVQPDELNKIIYKIKKDERIKQMLSERKLTNIPDSLLQKLGHKKIPIILIYY